MNGRLAVTQRGGQPEAEDGSYHTTQDPERDLPMFTTAPPFSSLDHHPPFKPFPPYDPRPQNHEEYFHDSGGASHHPTMPSRSHHLRDASTQLVPHEDAPPFSDVAASRPTTSAPSSAALTQPYASNVRHGPSAETQRRVSEDPHVTMTIGALTTTDARTSAVPFSSSDKHLDADVTVSSNVRAFHVKASKERSTPVKEEHDATGSDVTGTASSLSGDLDDETTTSTIITTTVITNMQTPGNV